MSANQNSTPPAPTGQLTSTVVERYHDQITNLIEALQAIKADLDAPNKTQSETMAGHLDDAEALAYRFSRFTQNHGDEIVQEITGQRPIILWLDLMASIGYRPEFVRRELKWLILQAPMEAERLLNLLEAGQR